MWFIAVVIRDIVVTEVLTSKVRKWRKSALYLWLGELAFLYYFQCLSLNISFMKFLLDEVFTSKVEFPFATCYLDCSIFPFLAHTNEFNCEINKINRERSLSISNVIEMSSTLIPACLSKWELKGSFCIMTDFIEYFVIMGYT
jgi:hypothetical protein